MRLIETTHLKTWAGSKQAESLFPYYVKALIEEVIYSEEIRWPTGDAVWVPGADGVLSNNETNKFVPAGHSVWELGTDSNYKKKANKDYTTRTDRSKDDGVNRPIQERGRSNITFVFVTPRVWPDKDNWVSDRKAEGIWKDVKVVDGADLQAWLEVAPAVGIRLAADIGYLIAAGLYIPEQAWEEWSYRTAPPMLDKLVLANREAQAKELIDRLSSTPCTFTIRGESLSEAWGFVLAALRKIPDEGLRKSLTTRVIVAENEEVARDLRYFKNLIIVLKNTNGQVSGFLSTRGCHVIVPEGNNGLTERNVIKLERPSHKLFAEALQEMGVPTGEVERISYESGLSITILQRQLAQANFKPPSWVDAPNVNLLLPALLACRWNDRNEKDREILCSLAGVQGYDELEGQINNFLHVDEAPLQKIGEMWTLTAPVDAFHLVARHLTAAYLNRYKEAFRTVFGRLNPRVELPIEEWVYQDIQGEQGHSAWLRAGMAETLGLIQLRSHGAKLNPPTGFIDDVIRGLPSYEDWRMLASNSDQLRYLIEAAPRPLLDSLEQLLEAEPDGIRKLFGEKKGTFRENMHTGLLWGLEVLAWSPEYLPRVALILAKLASLDPGGSLHNRPINSLTEIFLWWHPGTNASTKQRLEVINLIISQEHEVGWELIANLLPHYAHSTSFPTAKPRWRDFGDLPAESCSRSGQMEYLSSIINRAIDLLGNDPKKWEKILASLWQFSRAQQVKTVELLNRITLENTPEEKRTALWEILRDFINQQKTYHGADWVLQMELVTNLENILPRLAPSDLVRRYKWLFDDWLPKLPTGERDLKDREKKVEELRRNAVGEIYRSQGILGIVSLGTKCQYPGFVAVYAVSIIPDEEKLQELIEHAITFGEPGISFAGQISGQAFLKFKNSWREYIINNVKERRWSPAIIAALLIRWPDERTTWDDVTALGENITNEYWRLKPVMLFGGTSQDKSYEIKRLIKAGRAIEAFDQVSHEVREVPTATLTELFDAAFDQLLQAQTEEEIRQFNITAYDVQEFLEELRKRSDLPKEEIARREYIALPVLGLQAHGLTIHEFMAEDPKFFIEVICNVFLPAHREKDEDVNITPKEQQRARLGYRLLKGMDKIPGHYQMNQINEEELLLWINEARNIAAKVDRAVIVDQHIGAILAHAQNDPDDGGWPHRVIRNVIEKLKANEIEHGLRVERYNMRGVFTKALYEGGAQERGLAEQCRDWEKLCCTRWPRMAKVLEEIALGWEKKALREDLRAEQDKVL